MRYLIFTNTPAHVHLYRNAVDELRARGHEVLVLGRDDSHTATLLEHYDLPYELYGRRGETKGSLARALPRQFASILRKARRYDPDLVFGRGAYSAFAATVTRRPLVLLLDSVPWRLGYVLPSLAARTVITTEAFADDLGSAHYRFRGLTECAYLHPDVYEPDPSVREDLGVGPDEAYAIVRFNGFGAFHDVGERGFDPGQGRDLIRDLAEHVTVFVSDESGELDLGALPARGYDLHPARIHDALAEASLFVTDTGTMATEAALVATPTVRASSRGDDDLGEFVQLHEEGLIRNVPPETVAENALDLATDPDAGERWLRRRDAFMDDRVNLTDLIVAVAEEPERVDALAERRDPGLIPPANH